ncbi:MAG: DUF928 domain-containing protein [Cyanobacteria bacterium J06649_4]
MQPLKTCSTRWISCVFTLAMLGANAVIALPSQAVEFPSTGDRGAPSSTAGGGTRDGCWEEQSFSSGSVVALVPENNVSTFASPQASLWIHLSDHLHQKSAELYVQNTNTRERVYSQNISLSTAVENDLLKLTLPETDASGNPLFEINQQYTWYFDVMCDETDRAQDYSLQGSFQRVTIAPALETRIESATLQTRAELYAEAALWQETLHSVEQLRIDRPEEWTELLNSVGLQSLISVVSPQTTPGAPLETISQTDSGLETDLETDLAGAATSVDSNSSVAAALHFRPISHPFFGENGHYIHTYPRSSDVAR